MLKSKSNTESDKYRCKGNELFDKKRMLQALKFYNAVNIENIKNHVKF